MQHYLDFTYHNPFEIEDNNDIFHGSIEPRFDFKYSFNEIIVY